MITALFADVAGSTTLGERLDPEDVREIVGTAIRRVVGAAESFGGTVKDLAGDGALILFGAPVAHEDDAERAVRAGLSMVDEIGSYADDVRREWGIERFGIRVGIETGLVVLGPVGAGARVEYGATGDVVNTAARLQSHAQLGTVLVGEATHRAVESRFSWSRPQTLELRGKAEPVRAWQAVAARGGRARTTAGKDLPLVGRRREVQTIQAAADALLTGSGGVIVITGEAGLGKSRLIGELARRVERSTTWLEGRCVSYAANIPYWPYRELLHAWLGQPETTDREALADATQPLFGDKWQRVRPFILTVLGIEPEQEDARRLAALSVESLVRGMAEAIGDLLRRLAADAPVTLVLEDLHWADTASLQLTDRLLRLADAVAVLIVLAARLEEQHPSGRLLRAANATPGARMVRLDALAGGDDRELLTSLVGAGTLPIPLERRLLEAAEGNPFYLEELVRSMADAGALRREDAGWRFAREVAVEVPETVEKVILARLDRLPAASRDAIDAASVIGRQFDLPLLSAVGGDAGDAAAVRDLVRLDLIRPEQGAGVPTYRFKHVLIAEAAYRSLLKKRRRELHLRAAEALEARFPGGLGGQASLLGRHYRAAGRQDRALELLRRGGAEARRAYAVEEAVRDYQAALEVAGEATAPLHVVAELHLELGEVLAQTGNISDARIQLEAALAGARTVGDSSLEMNALGELGFLLAGAADYREAEHLLEEALRLAGATDDRAGQVRMLSRLCIVAVNLLRLDRAAEYGDRALALSRGSDDERLEAMAMDALKQVALQLGDARRVAAIGNVLAAIHERHEDLWLLQFVHFERAYVWTAVGRWDDALAEYATSLEINRRITDRGNEPLLLSTLARHHAIRGDYGEALQMGRAAADMATQLGHAEWTSWSELVLGATLLDLHALEEADRRLDRARQAAEASGSLLHLLRAAALLAWCRWRRSDREAAERSATEAEGLLARMATPPGTALLTAWDAYGALARVRLASGDPAAARALLEPMLSAADLEGWVEATSRGSVVLAMCLQSLDRGEEAEDLLVLAVDRARTAGMPGAELEARTALLALYRAGRSAEASDQQSVCHQLVDSLSRRLPDESIRAGFVHAALAELEEGRQ